MKLVIGLLTALTFATSSFAADVPLNKGPVSREGNLNKNDYIKAFSTVKCAPADSVLGNLAKQGFEPSPIGGMSLAMDDGAIDVFTHKVADGNLVAVIVRESKTADGKNDMACILDVFAWKVVKTTES